MGDDWVMCLMSCSCYVYEFSKKENTVSLYIQLFMLILMAIPLAGGLHSFHKNHGKTSTLLFIVSNCFAPWQETLADARDGDKGGGK